MPQRSLIRKLPEEVRQQLDQRLIAAAFGDLHGASAWLRGQGFSVGKSTVGLYALQLRRQIANATPTASIGPDPIAVRLACLEAAAQVKGSPAAVLERATAYVAWATLAPVDKA